MLLGFESGEPGRIPDRLMPPDAMVRRLDDVLARHPGYGKQHRGPLAISPFVPCLARKLDY